MNNTPLFSVIIPTCHRNNVLSKCLDCLDADIQSISSEQYEVIVTDDGVESTALNMIKENYPWVKWYEGPHKGPAANRNNGAKYAKGEWLVFIDDDCIAEPNLLQEYQSAVNTNSALALEGTIHPLGDPNQDLAECPINTEGGCFWSANIAVKKELFNKLGGFDENYLLPASEDQDLFIRVKQYSTIKFVKAAKVHHPVRFLRLMDAIRRVKIRSNAWAYHAIKNSKYLGYRNGFDALHDAYKFQFRVFYKNLLSARFRNSIISIVYLSFGLPSVFKQLITKIPRS